MEKKLRLRLWVKSLGSLREAERIHISEARACCCLCSHGAALRDHPDASSVELLKIVLPLLQKGAQCRV